MEEKWVFIVNPVSGNGSAKNVVVLLERMLKKHNINAEIVYTERPGHATELAQHYAEKEFNYIITVGGDGTLNEMTRPLLNNKKITVGIVPAGTGNDFIQILGLPDRFTEVDFDIFFSKNRMGIDVGKVNNVHFLNGMGLGFDAEVAAQNYDGTDKVKQGGKHKYVWHILKTLFFFREKIMTVVANGKSGDTQCFINTIAIGRRFAGGFFLTPQAIANDGLLDVCMIKSLSLLQRLKILLMVPKGTHISDPKIHYYQTEKLTLEFKDKVPFHVDGELNFASHFDVKVIPAALNIIYNPNGDHFFKR